MPRYTTSQTYTDGNTQIVALPEGGGGGNGSGSGSGTNNQIVEVKGGEIVPADRKDDEDLEEKLRRIGDQVPVRISNTSGSSAGSGSGDFHQYRQMRRREQDRLARMEYDYQKRTEMSEFLARREERMRAAEERTAKKRAKRQKKKQKKKQKKQEKSGGGVGGDEDGKEPGEEDDESSDEDEDEAHPRVGSERRGGLPPLPTRVAVDHSVVATPHVFVRKSAAD